MYNQPNLKQDTCPLCGGAILMVEYPITDPYHHDGISEYACQNSLSDSREDHIKCTYRLGRFCGKILGKNEQEGPYCTGNNHPVHASYIEIMNSHE